MFDDARDSRDAVSRIITKPGFGSLAIRAWDRHSGYPYVFPIPMKGEVTFLKPISLYRDGSIVQRAEHSFLSVYQLVTVPLFN